MTVRRTAWLRPDATLARDLKANALPAALSGLLCALLFPPFDLYWLCPVAFVPLLLALRRTSGTRVAGYLALLFGLVLGSVSLHWMWAIFSSGSLALYVVVSLPWLLFGLAYRFLSGRVTPLSLALLTPVLFTAAEWLRCEGWYFRFSWLQPGACFVAAEAAQSVYPLVGVYGMTFLALLANALVALAVVQPDRARRLRALAGAAAYIAVVALGFRVAWLTYTSHVAEATSARSVKTLLMQAEEEDPQWLAEATRQYRQARPQLIVWPELAVNTLLEEDPEALAGMQAVARDLHGVLVSGAKTAAPPRTRCDWLRRRAMLRTEGKLYYNSAVVIGPQGQHLGEYHKRYPIQFFADGVPGEGYPVFLTPVGRLGVAICYDFDFAATALNLTRNGAEFIVVPTYDARNWGPVQQLQHARLARARAAEVGRWVVRPTSSGVSQIITPGGEQVTYLPSGPASHTLGLVETRTHTTPYVRVGWRLPYACLVLSLLALAWGGWRGRARAKV